MSGKKKTKTKTVNLLKLRWDQRRVKPRRVLTDRTCNWCLQASQSALCSGKSSYMTWISLRVRCHKVGSVQMCSHCKIGAPPRRTTCAVTTAPLSFWEQEFTLCCLCSAGSTLATEDWSVVMFTFQEERLGRCVCIGLKRLQSYWQIPGKKWQDAEPRTGKLLPLFTRNNSAKPKLESVVFSSLQVSVWNYKIDLCLQRGLTKNYIRSDINPTLRPSSFRI